MLEPVGIISFISEGIISPFYSNFSLGLVSTYYWLDLFSDFDYCEAIFYSNRI